MPNFRCDTCGYSYSDTHTFTNCPNCHGLGKLDPMCICVCYRESFSMKRLNRIKEKNPKCPVHGTATDKH